MNENFTRLLPKIWWLIILVSIGGFIVGLKLAAINNPQLIGLVIFLYTIGVFWGGSVLGYQIKASEKK